MARTITQIETEMNTELAAQTALAAKLTSTSSTAIYRLWITIMATCIYYFEVLQDAFKSELETIAIKAVPGTPSWLQAKVLEFQYDSTTPQVIQLVNFYPTYPTVDTTKRIITRCAVSQGATRRVTVKVAKGSTPTVLDSNELSALKDYLSKIRFAGTIIEVVSLISDKLKLTANIHYSGQYVESNVKTAVINAITEYLENVPFDGVVYLSHLVDAIQAVDGVVDVEITEAKARDNGTAITASGAQVFTRIYSTSAGYIVPETTSGHTLNDTLTMIAVS